MRRSGSHCAIQRGSALGPFVRVLAQHREARADVLAALMIVRRGRQHGVRERRRAGAAGVGVEVGDAVAEMRATSKPTSLRESSRP